MTPITIVVNGVSLTEDQIEEAYAELVRRRDRSPEALHGRVRRYEQSRLYLLVNPDAAREALLQQETSDRRAGGKRDCMLAVPIGHDHVGKSVIVVDTTQGTFGPTFEEFDASALKLEA